MSSMPRSIIGWLLSVSTRAKNLLELFEDRSQTVTDAGVNIKFREDQKTAEHDSLAEARRDAPQPLVPVTILLIPILVVADDRIAGLVCAKEKKVIRLRATRDFTDAIILVQQMLVLVAFTKVFQHKPSIGVEDAKERMALSL